MFVAYTFLDLTTLADLMVARISEPLRAVVGFHHVWLLLAKYEHPIFPFVLP
jgi:hypothetical protein